MSERTCSTCGAPLGVDTPAEGLCPDCLFDLALGCGDESEETLADDETATEQIGPYRLLRKLGEGGMGVVHLAEQQEPVRRQVALKLVKLGMDTKQVLARFESERQVLALLDHPNIAKVYDAGMTEIGRPYFVMQYVPGIPITEYCDRERLGVPQRLQLFVEACKAVEHAHQKGVIHRDLKPSNVLVSLQDGEPVPKAIDFGVAKATNQRLTEHTLHTMQGAVVGTPEYMSPEQADPTELDVDTRTDVYSLGVLLYELLTGLLPHPPEQLRRAPLSEMQRILREDEPERPSTRLGAGSADLAQRRDTDAAALKRVVAGDLDWITMRSLEKERTRRYGSAAELAADIERYRNDEPVLARPPSFGYQLGKLGKRHPLPIAFAGVVFVLLIGFAITMAAMLAAQNRERARADAERDRAVREAAKAESVNSFLQGMLASANPDVTQGRDLTVVEVLDEAAGRVEGGFEEPALQSTLHQTLGDTYHALGRFETARTHLERALDLRRTIPEFDPDDLVSLLLDLGELLRDTAELERANELAQEAFDTTKGGEGLQTADALALLASIARESGELEEAEHLSREALAMYRATVGDSHSTAVALKELAWVLNERGETEEVEALVRESVEMNRRLHGEGHPAYAESLASLGVVLYSQRRLDEAESVFRESASVATRAYGPEHPNTAKAMYNLGSLLRQQGRIDESVQVHRETLAIRRRVLPEDHPDIGRSLDALASALGKAGDVEEAAVLGHAALVFSERVNGPDHPLTLVSLNNVGSMLRTAGRLAEAEPILLRNLELRRKVYGNRHLKVSTALIQVADLRRSQGRPREAEELFRDALAIRTEVLRPGDPRIARVYRGLGHTLGDQDRFAEADENYVAALEIYRAAHESDHPDIDATLEDRKRLRDRRENGTSPD